MISGLWGGKTEEWGHISILKIIRCRQLNFIYYALVVCFSKKMGEEERKVYFSVKEDFNNFSISWILGRFIFKK